MLKSITMSEKFRFFAPVLLIKIIEKCQKLQLE